MVKTLSTKSKREWGDTNNLFVLHNGVVHNDMIKFDIRRRRQTPALRFCTGDELVLTYQGKKHHVIVDHFAPRSRTGSVISAAGKIAFVMHEGIARILHETSMRGR
jgi:hypothetical protein